jgi:hypothetical protein
MAYQIPIQVTMDVELAADGSYIHWHAPILGHRRTAFMAPYPPADLPTVIKALDAIQYPDHPTGGPQFTAGEQATLASYGLWLEGRVVLDAYHRAGMAIYDALGPEGRNALENVRAESIYQGLPVTYVLRFPRDGVPVAALPWEIMANQDGPILLSRGNHVDSCERYMDIDRALPPLLHAGRKPHLLAIAPIYGIPDDLYAREWQARHASWAALAQQDLITFDEPPNQLPPADSGVDASTFGPTPSARTPLTVRLLDDYLRHPPGGRAPDIVHYFGHGVYRNGEGYLLFDDEHGGKDLVSTQRLATMLGDVRLVTILACQSAMIDETGGLLTGIAPALSIVTGAVVAMQLSVRVEAATRFAEVFYDELLLQRRSIQDAVAEARRTLYVEEDDGVSWGVPTLYIRSREQRPLYLLQQRHARHASDLQDLL